MYNNSNLPAGGCQTTLFNSLQSPLEVSSLCISHQKPTQISNGSNSSQHIKSQAGLRVTLIAVSLTESSPQQIFSHQDQKRDQMQTSIMLTSQKGDTASGNSVANTVTTTASCYTNGKLTLGMFSTDFKTSSSRHPSHGQMNIATAGLTGDTQAPNSNVLDSNNLLPSETFTYLEADDCQDTKDNPSNDYTSQSSYSWGPDISNKYQSFCFPDQPQSNPQSECLVSGVRPVRSCQDNAEDTSSSDDEGKLIIEL